MWFQLYNPVFNLQNTHFLFKKYLEGYLSPQNTYFLLKNIWRDISPFKSLFFRRVYIQMFGGISLSLNLSLYGGCTSNLDVFRCRFCPFGVGPRMLILKYIVHLLRMSSFQQIKTTNDIFLVFH